VPAFDERPNRDFRQRNNLGLEPQFVNDIYNHNKWQVEVSRDECFSAPMAVHKGSEPSSKEKEDVHNQRDPGCVWLERRCPGELRVTIDSLLLASVIEAKIDNTDADPVHQGRDRHKVL